MEKSILNNNFILLAEDDEDDQELIRMAFSHVTSTHRFEIVSNGQKVLESLQEHSNLPCLIILDLNMPVLNGFQTLIAMRNDARLQHVPKVILTTSDDNESKKKSFSYGAVDYFVKPASMDDFIFTAQKMLTYCDKYDI
ncbi:MAG TPA: response regulator [Ohtaekwangia sp.]|nr:response regulator [Ohtaekwangia sp.]